MSFLVLTLLLPATAATVEEVSARGGRPAHGWVVGTVDTPAHQVLDILQDCEGFSEWFPDLVETQTVAPRRCAGRTHLPWPLPDRTWVLETTTHPHGDGGWEVAFAMTEGSGNLADMHGRWLVEPMADGPTRVSYEAQVDLGLPVPDVLVAWATRQILPRVLPALEAFDGRPMAPGPLGTRAVALPGRLEVVDDLRGTVHHRQPVQGRPTSVGFVGDGDLAWAVDDRIFVGDAASPALGSPVVALCGASHAVLAKTADGRQHRWYPGQGEVTVQPELGCAVAASHR